MQTIRTTTRSLFPNAVLAFLLGTLFTNPLPMQTYAADPESLRQRQLSLADIPTANNIQDMYSLTPLVSSPSNLGRRVDASVFSRMRLFDLAIERGSSTASPPELVAALTGVEFLNILSSLMCDNPAPRRDDLALWSFRSIGFVPCRPFHPSRALHKILTTCP